MEKVVNVKEFKVRATQYVNGRNEVVITKYGRPLALLTPIEAASPEGLLLSIGEIMREAGITQKEARKALTGVRKRLYGPRRS